MSDIAIKIENLGKRYRYGAAARPGDSLRADLMNWARGLFGRADRRPMTEDPRRKTEDRRPKPEDLPNPIRSLQSSVSSLPRSESSLLRGLQSPHLPPRNIFGR